MPDALSRKYRVVATRVTVYEVDADDRQHAIDEMIEGNGTEVDGTTERIDAEPLCPTCKTPLSNRTTREIEVDEFTYEVEPNYCDTCDREV